MDQSVDSDSEDLTALFRTACEDAEPSCALSLKDIAMDYVVRNYYKLKVASIGEIVSEDLGHDLLLCALEAGKLSDPFLHMFDHETIINPEIQRQVNQPIVQQGEAHVLPIHYAVQYNYVDLLRFLIRHGADVNADCEIPQARLRCRKTSIQSRQTPFMTAVFLERNDLAKILLDAGANLHCTFYVVDRTWPFSCNPLRFAMAFQNVELVKYLLDKGCFVDSETQAVVKIAEKQFSKEVLELVRSTLKKQEEQNRPPPAYIRIGPEGITELDEE